MSQANRDSASEVCAVVGVGGGLGAALAFRFAQRYGVALIARSSAVIDEVAGRIRSGGGTATSIRSDATVQGEIAAAHERKLLASSVQLKS